MLVEQGAVGVGAVLPALIGVNEQAGWRVSRAWRKALVTNPSGIASSTCQPTIAAPDLIRVAWLGLVEQPVRSTAQPVGRVGRARDIECRAK